MTSVLINTTPQQKHLYAVKKYEDKVFTMPFHMHERFELTCIIKGKGTRIIGDNIQDYRDGDIVLMAPFTSHHWQSGWIGEPGVSAVTLFFSKQFPTDDFRLLPEFNAISSLLEAAKFGIELKGDLRRSILSKMQKLSEEYSLLQMLNVLDILNEIAQSDDYVLLMNSGYSILKKNDRERITQIVSYIRANIAQKITIQELANIACMHHGSVNRFFKQSTGFSLIQYINLTRIGLACQLLVDSEKTILDVAVECGFHNLSHFNRTFKSIKSCTPKEYRKNF